MKTKWKSRNSRGLRGLRGMSSLRSRVMLILVAAVLLLASLSALLIETTMRDSLEKALHARGLTITKGFAGVAVDPVLLRDEMEVRRLMRRVMDAEPDVIYMFVEGPDGKLVASTFPEGLPIDLANVNDPVGSDPALRTLDTEQGLVLDIAVPILDGGAGVAHVGLAKAQMRAALDSTRRVMLGSVFAILAVGLLMAYVGGQIVARPLERLAVAAAEVQAGDLSVRADVPESEAEVGFLAAAFNGMLQALEEDIWRRQAAEAALQRSHDELETRVAERTDELASANEELAMINEELNATNEELAAANIELDKERRRAEQATQAKSDFLASMSHDLRTPLNSIIGFSDIMLRGLAGQLNEEQRRQLEMVHSSGIYLLTLINDILDLSRIERGHVELLPCDVDVSEVVRGAFESFEPVGAQKGLEMRLRAPGSACIAYSDPLRLEQIVVNLIGNAVKFTDEGFVEVSVMPDGDAFTVRVADSGPGIPSEDLPHVFEEYYQVRSHVDGSGLGLTIAERLSRALGGTLVAESQVGEGSAFTLRLPFKGPIVTGEETAATARG